jgi:asparagine synthase (glutamine-hydrolysing)
MLSGDTAFVFEGRLFPPSSKDAAKTLLGSTGSIEEKAIDFIQNANGAYVFGLCGETVVVGRDAVGACPLYFGESEEVCAVATERKALWEIGIAETHTFRPGKVARIDGMGFHFKDGRLVEQPDFRELDLKSAGQHLCKILVGSAERRVSDVARVAVAFSGGVDSVTVALLAKLCNVETDLVCVTLPKQREAIFAKRAAKALDMPFHLATLSEEDVEKTLPKALWLIEEPDPVSASIAVPMLWVAEQSVRLGCRVMIAGQGGDELFGGYSRYLRDYAEDGMLGLQRSIFRDVSLSYDANLQRDNKICAHYGLELRLPFADWEVMRFALSLHPSLRINSPKDRLRKRVLRTCAIQLGAPRFIAERPKKAIQYATGVSRVLKRIAKREHLTLRAYLERLYQKTIDMWGQTG